MFISMLLIFCSFDRSDSNQMVYDFREILKYGVMKIDMDIIPLVLAIMRVAEMHNMIINMLFT